MPWRDVFIHPRSFPHTGLGVASNPASAPSLESHFPRFKAAMAEFFPRGPSPYPSRFPTPSLASSPSSSNRSSFEKPQSRTSSDASVVEAGPSNDTNPPQEGKMARPTPPDRRNSLASLSVAHDANDAFDDDPTWPSGWRPYTCLLGGFCLMFNSWGLVSGRVACRPDRFSLIDIQVNAYGTYASYYMQHLMPDREM